MDFYENLLYAKIKKIISRESSLTDYYPVNQDDDIENKISKALKSIRRDGYNILLVFDDMDRYHFYHDKFSLFDETGECSQALDQIIELYKKFAKSDYCKPLSCLGISVVFVCRDYVYSMIDEREGLNPRCGRNLCYEINKPDYRLVVNKRLTFLLDILNKLNKKGDFWDTVKENILVMKSAINSLNLLGLSDFSTSSNLENIFLLSHHGCRSIIDFLKGLRLFGTEIKENVIRRYLVEDHSAIVVLYLLNHKKLYTQDSNHFPNIYLVNAHIMSGAENMDRYPDAFLPHRHTYWLKFLILSYLLNSGPEGCSTGEVISVFSETGGYEESLVKLVIGSLATPNWFSCIAVEYESSQMDKKARRIYLTNRGKYLFNKKNKNQLFCFSFTYLQLVVDDYLLHFPKELDKYKVINDYSYLYEDRGLYGDGFVQTVQDKFGKIMRFLSVLEHAYEAECLRDEKLFKYLNSSKLVLPDFKDIYYGIESEIVGYLGANRTYQILGDTSEIISKNRNNREMTEFFKTAYFGDNTVIVE